VYSLRVLCRPSIESKTARRKLAMVGQGWRSMNFVQYSRQDLRHGYGS
jgi:hypothetical protein